MSIFNFFKLRNNKRNIYNTNDTNSIESYDYDLNMGKFEFTPENYLKINESNVVNNSLIEDSIEDLIESPIDNNYSGFYYEDNYKLISDEADMYNPVNSYSLEMYNENNPYIVGQHVNYYEESSCTYKVGAHINYYEDNNYNYTVDTSMYDSSNESVCDYSDNNSDLDDYNSYDSYEDSFYDDLYNSFNDYDSFW